ncbi:ABC transporter ATP-binding protein [Natronobacterium gregoryi]|uniref:ABC transporter n=2 Tax=Natronobacterium gregoryi TaxID=44930 RepID=L0AHF2_NATGS|nr:ABC transporter ATP-binding protein [Natronobacterium gregoryi]AFZ72869.1 ABC-type multidrug transport system, ATPase component [Natronobacterium gregoryi SP2]ELY69641.1 ABC transporter [Natronobacterium gregoryi SP2]PLK21902.1 ABC transporter ATP-binding protein [Natronobacterium gregoryi SP2]SFI66071.1 ABC-2 type transport system ATP-binding protein [Natronobacterium gregoryi]
MPPAIETVDLVKEYGDLRALQELSLTVEEGEFFGLLGPNGAGKTTFINTLVGLVRKTGGEARVFGYDVEDDYRAARDAIGLAPQEFNVDRFFPIREVLMHKAGYHGVPEDEAAERADEALKRVGIYDKRNERFDWLSGGMKRRLLLARALVTDPDLLILDEPTAGVDVQLRHDLWELVTELNAEGTTVLLTTHYIEEAERLCDRVAIVNEGRKVTVATPDELKKRGTDTVSVRLESPISTAASTLEESLGAYAHDVSTGAAGNQLEVRVDDGGSTAPRLLNDLETAGYEIADLEISRTSLEEIFVDLTRSEDRTVTRSSAASEDGDDGPKREQEGVAR